MAHTDIKQSIKDSIQSFQGKSISEAALELFSTLGYNTDRQAPLDEKSYAYFKGLFPLAEKGFNEDKARAAEWKYVDLLFQLTTEEFSEQGQMFDSGEVHWEGEDKTTVIETYLFFAIELSQKNYSRTALAGITRELNKVFPMPVMVVFKYDDRITLSLINRRLHKKDAGKDVLEKVTLIKDISITRPHRAHIEILHDLTLDEVRRVYKVKNFVELHQAWSKVLDLSQLNKLFYKRVADLFYKLTGGKTGEGRTEKDYKNGVLVLPSVSPEAHIHRKEFGVRLIGRSVFCWFLREKGLIPEQTLNAGLVKDYDGFYHKHLEPLFFQAINTPWEDRRKGLPAGFELIPFLNGGLFEPHEFDYYKLNPLSGWSEYINTLKIPDDWLSDFFGLLEEYKFTVDENTPLEEDVALDPELLGRIFENLLAEINPETGDTARKSTGSFYTPRPIVDYMVKESLKQHLITKSGLTEERVLPLFDDSGDALDYTKLYTEDETDTLILALHDLKILDPACGSGAFPMGILNRVTDILRRIDPQSRRWFEKKIMSSVDELARDELRDKMANENWDYIHKMGLIRDSIYGVDIQPIAVEISRLRVFLSLIIEEQPDDSRPNRGIKALPNLEFKFVCANTLIGLPEQEMSLGEDARLIAELKRIRQEYFTCHPDEKPGLQKQFGDIQDKMFRKSTLWSTDTMSHSLAAWEPFSDNACGWFDPEWMFGVEDGFDVVIGNPPYVVTKKDIFQTYQWTGDLYTMFFELAVKTLLKNKGVCSFITPRFFLFNQNNFEMRNYLLHNLNIHSMVDCNPFDAVTENEITVLSNEKAQSDRIDFYYFDSEKIGYMNTVHKNWITSNRFFEINPHLTEDVFSVLQKIKSDNKTLGEVSFSKRGAEIGKKELKTSSIGNQILLGYDVNRFHISPSEAKIDTGHKEFIRLSHIFNHSDIVLLRRVAKDLISAHSNKPIAFSKNLYGIIPNKNISPHYLISLLNSKLLNFYYKKKFSTKKEEVFPEVQTYLYEQLPIREVENNRQVPLIKLSEEIHFILQERPNSDISKLETELDQQVYRIYNLTEEEIKIVEGSGD